MDCKSLLTGLILLGLPTLAATSAVRPACDAKHVGQFWPDTKNNVTTVQQLARSGELEVCARTQEWRYGWTRLTITVDQLKPERKKLVSSSTPEETEVH